MADNGYDVSIKLRGSEYFVLFTQICAGDKIEKNEMDWACDVYGGGEGCV